MTAAMPRTDPPEHADERQMLAAWLDYHRATLAMKCADLTDAQLRVAAVPPSTLSLVGLVRHMSEVERGWFRRTMNGEDAGPIYYSDESPDGDFEVEQADVAEAFGTWTKECEAARVIERSAASLEVSGTQRLGNTVSLRWVMVHMIEEYARHNGHADLLRERLDGVVGE